MNTRQAYQKVRTLTGTTSRTRTSLTDPISFTVELNNFFARFDKADHSAECESLLRDIPALEHPFSIPFTEEDVYHQLRRCKSGKAPGPDGISGRLLKTCAMELAPVLFSLFSESILSHMPVLWKTSIIIPVPKKPRPTELNHYRPVALTSIIAKCLEKLVLNAILPVVNPHLDPHQFAYKEKRGTEDAVACLLHTLLQHLDTPGHFARVNFIDFSSAFNTIQRHLVISKLHSLHIPPPLIHFIHDFLSDRPQAVRLGSTTSPFIIINTGAPQGCVLSPFLYTLYTNDCLSPSPVTKYFKYSDDTAILALLSDQDSVTAYKHSVAHFSQWCKDNHLLLNVTKTKELIFDNRKKNTPHEPIHIDNQPVEIVDSFKYLGITLDNKLNFNQHTSDITKRCQQRTHIIRKLRALSIKPPLLLLLYRSIIESILLYCATGYFTMLPLNNKNKLLRVTHTCSKIIGLPTPSLPDLINDAIIRKSLHIAHDHHHPLHPYFTLLPSGRRFRQLSYRTSRFSKSFVPSAITALNSRR